MSTKNARVIHRSASLELSVLDEQGVALLKLDCQDKPTVNLLSSAVMQEIADVLSILEGAATNPDLSSVKGLVFYSGKENCFVAGADIKEIQRAQTMEIDEVYEACHKGKAVLDRFKFLKMSTVCAVNGRCLGGGLELMLRFGHRIASNNKSTVFGLPEVGLGVIPGWGGTVIMTRAYGFKAALTMILNPLRPWSAERAYKQCLVQELVDADQLLDRAIAAATSVNGYPGGRPLSAASRISRKFFDSKLGRKLCRGIAGALVKLTLGNESKFPAPFAAMAVMESTFDRDTESSMSLESGQFAALTHTEGCKKAVQRFLEHQAKKKNS